MLARFSQIAVTLSATLVFIGCGQSPSGPSPAEVSQHRAQYLLDEEPEGVLPVMLVREMLSDESDVLVLGRIGGVATPFEEGRAVFMMADPSLTAAEGDGHDCTDSGCAFCKRKKQNETDSLALVEFVGGDGRIVPIDARRLFDVDSDHVVVVRGKARIDSLGQMVVAANGLYVRR